jgi:alkanesulfonate monooxygenase SsuD/methylene tetrahydromethanopterin reductase-like flavin-dependent oxidoreductase (luciferase family)
MRVGATIINQNYTDWDRYEAEERGEKVSARASKPDSEVFQEELNLVRFADESGFDSVWTIEHHFTPYTMVTNPMQYLTYVSAITKNVDLGTMVNVLPWRHPVQLAEDIIMLHTFLGPKRQFFCGVGRGLGRREYEGLGIDQADGRGRFDESLLILRELLSTGMCKFDGKHYHLNGVRLRPQPERDLSDCLWGAGGTDDTVAITAKHDVRPLIVPTTSLGLARETAVKHAKLHRAAGYEPSKTKLALWMFCAETDAEADKGAKRYMMEYTDSALRHYELLGDHLGGIKGYESYGVMQNALRKDPNVFRSGFYESHPWGGPDKVIKEVTRLAESFGTDEITFLFKYGGMPIEVAEKSMRLFAKEVMPAIKELNPEPIELQEAA